MTPVEVARVWGPEVGKIALDLKEPIGKKLSKRREQHKKIALGVTEELWDWLL